MAGSFASVVSRHLMTAASQNRGTQFVISLPINLSHSGLPKPSEIQEDGQKVPPSGILFLNVYFVS